MGQLIESAWNLDEKCRFKVLPLGNEKTTFNPPPLEEHDADVPGSLGLSMSFLYTFAILYLKEVFISRNQNQEREQVTIVGQIFFIATKTSKLLKKR